MHRTKRVTPYFGYAPKFRHSVVASKHFSRQIIICQPQKIMKIKKIFISDLKNSQLGVKLFEV